MTLRTKLGDIGITRHIHCVSGARADIDWPHTLFFLLTWPLAIFGYIFEDELEVMFNKFER